MSLKPQELGPIPEETTRVARAAYPKGNVFMRMRDELGVIYQYEAAAPGFLREIPAVQILRQVWIQNYSWTDG